jgi:hypothetical protein
VVGVIHQAVWLATSRERWLASDWEPAGRTSDRNNLHQIGLAAHNYHDGERHFPPGGRMDEHGRPRHGWQTFLLPYIDQTPLFKRIDLQRAWNSAPNAPHFHTRIPVYQNPHIVRNVAAESLVDNAGFSHSHYAANERVLGANSRMEIGDISDGTSNTIMAGDVNGNFRPWGDPVNWRDPAAGINSSASGFGSPFSGGANFLLCDGTVRFISEKVDPAVLKAISTPAGGEPVEGF